MLACVCLLSYWLIGPSWCQTRPSCCEGQWVGDGLHPSLGGISWIDQDRVIAETTVTFQTFRRGCSRRVNSGRKQSEVPPRGDCSLPESWLNPTSPSAPSALFSLHTTQNLPQCIQWARSILQLRPLPGTMKPLRLMMGSDCSVQRSEIRSSSCTIHPACCPPPSFCFLLLCLLEQIRLLCGVTSGVWPLGPLIPPSLALGSPRTLGP